MKKLCYYKILQSAEAYKLMSLAESVFKEAQQVAEILAENAHIEASLIV